MNLIFYRSISPFFSLPLPNKYLRYSLCTDTRFFTSYILTFCCMHLIELYLVIQRLIKNQIGMKMFELMIVL